jgi:hypothetical protein
MTGKEELPREARKSISEQIERLLSGVLKQQSPAPKSVELGESFSIWTLDVGNLDERSLSASAFHPRRTGLWHHQIFFDGEPKGWAESEMRSGQPVRVLEVSLGPIAKKIDDAIDWIEKHEVDWAVSNSSTVRFLAIKQLLIYTFWLFEPRKIYLIDIFPEFQRLTPGRLVDEDSFVALLAEDLRVREERLKRRR